jgi:glycosyltransferase involved in cell wall biosynthesis
MKRKKILLLSDDMRMHSGIARVSRDFVVGTLDKYDWVQVAGALNHPENGKRVKIESDKTFKMPKDAEVILYPVTGYGNQDLIRGIIQHDKPDAILHFTDPRFWVWLYQMEHEIRQNIPIIYLNIWDDLPDPDWNENFYRSCDSLMAISKQTYGINKRILNDYEDWRIKYVPHGMNSKQIFKVDKNNLELKKFEQEYGIIDYKFKLTYINRNIRRKQPGDVVLAYKHFMDKLTEEQRKECVLIFHTAPIDENGTDLKAVHQAICPEYPVVFTYDKGGHFDDLKMNYLFNSSDVVINIASNEGFGLATCEALTVGTPIIVNVTGGLQDQCGFKKEDGSYLSADDYVELGSNHKGEYKEHGEWVKPVFPSNISLQGSPQTPYIFDDRCQYQDAGEAIKYWYDKGPDERERCGELGMEFVKDKNIGMDAGEMSNRVLDMLDETLEKWKPREKYTLEVV